MAKRLNNVLKAFSIIALVVLSLVLLGGAFFAKQPVQANVASVASQEVHHHHHHTNNVKAYAIANVQNLLSGEDINIGEHSNKLMDEGTPDPIKCEKCGCEVYACSKCWSMYKENGEKLEVDPATGKQKYRSICPAEKGKPYVCPMNITAQPWYQSMMQVVDVVDGFMLPIIIVIGTAGSIFVIVLGVQFSKAESADKREEAKKRMINAIIGVVITVLMLILIKLFTANAPAIIKWIKRV